MTMPNFNPIYSLTPHVEGALVVTAASAVNDISGTVGTDIYLLFTAGAQGSYIERVRMKYVGPGTTTSVAALLKIWVSKVLTGTPGLGTDAWLLGEQPLPVTGTLSATNATGEYDFFVGFPIASDEGILAKITASQPSGYGWSVAVIGGNY